MFPKGSENMCPTNATKMVPKNKDIIFLNASTKSIHIQLYTTVAYLKISRKLLFIQIANTNI